MSNINRVVLTGNLCADPEVKTLPSGTSVSELRLAVNTRQKVGGDWTDKAHYFDVVLFGQQAENAAKYLAKGRPVAIDGRLDFQQWEKDGQRRSTVKIVADTVQYLASNDVSQDKRQAAQSAHEQVEETEDIPF